MRAITFSLSRERFALREQKLAPGTCRIRLGIAESSLRRGRSLACRRESGLCLTQRFS
jgi:hypothetical protein